MNAAESADRAVIAAQVVGTVENRERVRTDLHPTGGSRLLHRGLIHPTKQIELARLVRAYNSALDGEPTPEAVARNKGRTS